MKCFIVTGIFDVGGMDEVVAFLGRRLPEHGIDTVVLHTGTTVAHEGQAGGRLPAALRAEGLQVEEASEASAAKLLMRYRPDVISAHHAPRWWLRFAAASSIPYVETFHGMHDLFGADWNEEAARSAHVAAYIAVSELVRQQFLARNGTVDRARVVTIPNSVDPRRIPPVDRRKARAWLNLRDEFLFVSLARHALQKNHYGLVQAFDEVARRYPNVHLLIAGRGDDAMYTEQVRRLRDGLRCRDRVHLRDHAPCPSALLAAADGFVLNSYFEGWSLASMEALCAGVPVILSDVGGAREQVGEWGERGYVVRNPLGDPLRVSWDTIGPSIYVRQSNRDELVAAMARMIEERELWNLRRKELIAESLARFHPDIALSRHVTILRAVAAKSASPLQTGDEPESLVNIGESK